MWDGWTGGTPSLRVAVAVAVTVRSRTGAIRVALSEDVLTRVLSGD
jgi:hypothetical protein